MYEYSMYPLIMYSHVVPRPAQRNILLTVVHYASISLQKKCFWNRRIGIQTRCDFEEQYVRVVWIGILFSTRLCPQELTQDSGTQERLTQRTEWHHRLYIYILSYKHNTIKLLIIKSVSVQVYLVQYYKYVKQYKRKQ